MDQKKVLIVGGGIAGIYCAWRLSQDDRFDITLIEGSSEYGGRILSLSLPGLGFPAELARIAHTTPSDRRFGAVLAT